MLEKALLNVGISKLANSYQFKRILMVTALAIRLKIDVFS